MQWKITDNLAGEVTEVETVVAEGDDQPLFEFKNEHGQKLGVQLTEAGWVVGTWNEAGHWIELMSRTDGRPACGHPAYGDTRNCAVMTCWNYTMKNKENW